MTQVAVSWALDWEQSVRTLQAVALFVRSLAMFSPRRLAGSSFGSSSTGGIFSASVKHLEVTYPDELTFDLRYPRTGDFPAGNLKPCRKVGLFETEIVAPFSHLQPNYILVHCAHGGISRSL
jgi:hypothetical protein